MVDDCILFDVRKHAPDVTYRWVLVSCWPGRIAPPTRVTTTGSPGPDSRVRRRAWCAAARESFPVWRSSFQCLLARIFHPSLNLTAVPMAPPWVWCPFESWWLSKCWKQLKTSYKNCCWFRKIALWGLSNSVWCSNWWQRTFNTVFQATPVW